MDGSCIFLFAVNSFAGIRDLGRANGACVDWRSFIRILPAAQQFLRKVAVQVHCPVDAWPFVDGSAQPREMFADSTLALLRRITIANSGICPVDFFAAWGIVIRALPTDKVNEIHQDGTSLLSCMLILAGQSEGELRLERLISQFIRRTDLDGTLLRSTPNLGPLGFPGFSIGSTAPVMWLCMRGKKAHRNGRSTHSGNRNMLEKVPHAVLESCFVPGPILPLHRDNILQYILEPVSRGHAPDKYPSEALLCQVVAQRFGLVDHIHRNEEGLCALSYAEQYVHNTGPAWHGGAWVRVCDIISEKMLDGCYDLAKRTDDESFLFLTYVVQELKGALESALEHEDLQGDRFQDCGQSHLRHIVASFAATEAKRADDIRMQWLARDWRFAHRGAAQQIAEVLQFFTGVRAQRDANNVRLWREASFAVQDLHSTSSELLNDDQITPQGFEALDEERQEAVLGQRVDAVTEHIVHSELAAMPSVNDAGYRAARQQLIVDEEWAQRRQQQINYPSRDDCHPSEGFLEQDGLGLHILEFSRAPKVFHNALDNDDDLRACTAALHQEGYISVGGAKVYVAPWEYRKAAPHTLGLQSRHVVASERYVEIVLAAVRGLKGKNKVHEKCENRREIVVGSRVEVTGLVSKMELNGHSGVVLRYVQSRARWAVRIIADEREVLVLPKNLRLGNNELLVKNTFIHIPTRSVASVSIGAQTY